jgi:rRNA maturation endonuclease Nob1
MDFNDLRTDIDLECPNCNRKFQQGEEDGDPTETECPACGETVPTAKPTNDSNS